MTREQWLKERRKSAGASESAAILGQSPHTSERTVYERKANGIDETPSSGRLYWGARFEPLIREDVAAALGPVSYDGPYTILRNPATPYMHATLDGYFDEPHPAIVTLFESIAQEPAGPGVLEIKTAGGFTRAAWRDGIPLHYKIQTQHQLAVTGYRWGVLAALIDNEELRFSPFVRHETFCAYLVERIGEFWQRVIDRDPPDADPSTSTRRTLAALHPDDDGQEIVLPAAAEVWDQLRTEAIAEERAAKRKRDTAELRLIDLIGKATFGVLPNGARYKYATQQRAGYVVEPKSFRVLRRLKG